VAFYFSWGIPIEKNAERIFENISALEDVKRPGGKNSRALQYKIL